MRHAWDTIVDYVSFCFVGTALAILWLIDRAFGLVLDWEDDLDTDSGRAGV